MDLFPLYSLPASTPLIRPSVAPFYSLKLMDHVTVDFAELLQFLRYFQILWLQIKKNLGIRNYAINTKHLWQLNFIATYNTTKKNYTRSLKSKASFSQSIYKNVMYKQNNPVQYYFTWWKIKHCSKKLKQSLSIHYLLTAAYSCSGSWDEGIYSYMAFM